jgi:hypothetical protein
MLVCTLCRPDVLQLRSSLQDCRTWSLLLLQTLLNGRNPSSPLLPSAALLAALLHNTCCSAQHASQLHAPALL